MPSRGAATGALLTGVALAVAALLAAPVAADAAPTGVTSPTADTVGGPDLASPGIVVRPGPGTSRLPTIDADTWLLADLTTGQVLAAKGAHTPVLPASTLKTLTSVALMPQLDPTTIVTATEADTHAVGSHVGLVAGATYTVWDLWNGLLLPSANDAASALARTNGGFPKTIADMTAVTQRLQANDTVPKTPSGLDTPGQVTSAYDMALIARAALQIPSFAKITLTMHYPFPGKAAAAGARRATYQIYTENRLLRHRYRGTVGGKTGFTSLAHRTFWAAASRGGHTLVVTLFQIHEPTETAARALLDWGFASLAKVTPVGTLVGPKDTSSPAPSAAGTPSQAPAAGGGTTASGGTTTSAGTGAPWKPIALVVALVLLGAGAFLWWRRRRPADPSPTSALAASTVAPRPARAAARTSPSVVVSGRHRAGPTVPPATTAPAAEATAVETSAVETPLTGAPQADAPADATPVTEAPVAEAPVAAPRVGGHVRIITPPGRTPEA